MNPRLLKDWAYGGHDLGGERPKCRVRHDVLANVSDTRAQERVLQFLNRERELSRTGFEEIVLDLRVEVRINDGPIGFEHGRRRQRRRGVLHECRTGRAVLMIATKRSPR